MVLLLPILTYAALQPDFAAYEYVPHAFLYGIGVPYAAVLWFENHFGEIFHFVIAMLLTWLLPAARLLDPIALRTQRIATVFVMATVAPLVEWWQWYTGRGFDPNDLLAHYAGMLIAVLVWLASRLRTR